MRRQRSAKYILHMQRGAHMVTVAKVNHSVRGRTEGSHIDTGVALAICVTFFWVALAIFMKL